MGSPDRRYSTNRPALSEALALDELYGLGFERADSDDARYEAVTLEEIKAAAKKYLTPDKFSVSIVKGVEDGRPEEK